MRGEERGTGCPRVPKRVPEGIPGNEDFQIAAFGRCTCPAATFMLPPGALSPAHTRAPASRLVTSFVLPFRFRLLAQRALPVLPG